MGYPRDYIDERVAAGCAGCGKIPYVRQNASGDAVLACLWCGWTAEPIDCGPFGGYADALSQRFMQAAHAETDPQRRNELETLALMYAGMRRAVY